MAINALESGNQLIFQADMIQYSAKFQPIVHDCDLKNWALFEERCAKKQRLHNNKVRR